MKNSFSFYTVLTLLSLTLLSCKDKIDLIGAGKESAVVIGILDASESTHYIKITRTFIGDGITNSLDIAEISDSSYFKDVSVKVQEILANGSTGRSWDLHDTIIQNKVNGAFYSPDQKVYVFYTPENAPLISSATYKLTATIDNGRIVVTGQTGLVSGINPGNWGTNLTIPIKVTTSGPQLGEYASNSFGISSVGNSYRMNASIRFDYREFSTGLTDSTDHSILFSMGETDVVPGTNQSFSLAGETFYRTLKDKIPVSSSIEKRVHLGFEITVVGASRELVNYINVNKPSSSLAQNKPKFTNLTITEGHSVIGIFASRQTYKSYRPAISAQSQVQALDSKSRRELSIGPTTGALGFCSRHVSDKFVPGTGNQSINNWYCGN
jgi:hypothetical protein